MKHSIILSLILSILLITSFACAAPAIPGLTATDTPTPTATPQPSATSLPLPTPTTAPTAVPQPAAPELGSKQFKEANDQLKYQIEVEYPYMQGETFQVGPFNQAMDTFVNQTVNGFKNDLAQMGESPIPNANNELQVKFTTPLVSSRVVSILYQAYFYYAGAAHPNSYQVAFNYDLAQNRMLELKDLFIPNTDYLTPVAAFCQSELKTKLGDAFFAEGAAPDEANYKNWNIKLDGLQFTFDPYQVGPYAAGPQQVLIPFSVLKDIAAPDGLLKSE